MRISNGAATATATSSSGGGFVFLATIALIVFKIAEINGASWAAWATYPWWFAIFGPFLIGLALTVVCLLLFAVVGGIAFGIYWLFHRRSEKKAYAQRVARQQARLKEQRNRYGIK